MNVQKALASYRRLRAQPLWQLLASDNGPVVIALLQSHLYENERTLAASVLHERIGRDLEGLRAEGEELPQSAKAYVASWLTSGYLERRFPAGATEEVYELSTATVEAIRFVSGLIQPHSAATESRLALVIEALARLSEDTDTDTLRRTDRLLREKARIDTEIASISQGKMRVLSESVALERTREIIRLAEDLSADFRRVRDRFEELNRELRERIVDYEGNRGEVLETLFAGIDVISDSEEGRTFSAFWRLLTDPEQSFTLGQALANVLSRDFIRELSSKERRFLLKLSGTLLEQGGMVHEVLQNFARSLKHFVQSREYLEHRRIHQLLKEAMTTALRLKTTLHLRETLEYSLALSSSRMRSLSQWVLYNPTLQAAPSSMKSSAVSPIDVDFLSQCLAQSEIDFRSLRANILAVLKERSPASIADVLEQYPAQQGLGTVVGLLALASREAFKTEDIEKVEWEGIDAQKRCAYIPKLFFLREKVHAGN